MLIDTNYKRSKVAVEELRVSLSRSPLRRLYYSLKSEKAITGTGRIHARSKLAASNGVYTGVNPRRQGIIFMAAAHLQVNMRGDPCVLT